MVKMQSTKGRHFDEYRLLKYGWNGIFAYNFIMICRSWTWNECIVVANVIAGCKADVVRSNKHANNQLVARTYSSKLDGKTQILTLHHLYS